MDDASKHEGCAYGYVFSQGSVQFISLASLTLNSVEDVPNYEDTYLN